MADNFPKPVNAESNQAEAIVADNATSGKPDTAPQGLRYIPQERVDSRTDEEIIEYLQKKHPVTSEKNVWYFWNTGWKSMKPWVQRGVIASVRRMGSEWTVHFTDLVPGSETHVYNYIDAEKYLPAVFREGRMDSEKAGQFQGDLVRLPLLLEYGGVWLDAGMILLRHLDDICWKKIEDPNSPYELAGFLLAGYENNDLTMANGFFATRAQNPFLQRVYQVYRTLWEDGATNQDGFHLHPLLRHMGTLHTPNKDIPVSFPDMGPITDYLSQTFCIERIRHLIDPNDGFNGPEYWATKIFGIAMPQEMWRHQLTTLWNGKRQWELFSKKRSGPDCVQDADWYEAETLVHEILSNSSVLKLSTGSPGTEEWWLATYWNKKEYEQADIEEGTFAAYLRWGSCHFDQIRELAPLKLELETERVWRAGVLEPVKVDEVGK
ncbi:related to capsule polysaccharide biosynthesis protein [Ramularia collo-cygni]|uniref:Related to capsule polysaccharide biosynthesis protein n=1 Tax=Ramularia collo-cygni TaxID=112498 RepID=A0A2D3V3B0_9PEZI|nr:related to capsule polysaccharide biosynthesis protein [Ramularia collo-cygni]CZT19177.1 related to capsule polysaccharide biosynthesis protein [Ramularia collo-cygni]